MAFKTPATALKGRHSGLKLCHATGQRCVGRRLCPSWLGSEPGRPGGVSRRFHKPGCLFFTLHLEELTIELKAYLQQI